MKWTIYREDYPVVETTAGRVHGLEIDGVQTYRGVPYAQAARFCRPRPVPAWDGVRDCVVWGKTAPTDALPASALYSIHTYWPQDEDCLNLNLWTDGTQTRKPVMVWFHGGGFSGGSSIDEAVTLGHDLAKTGRAVVVSVNHRLGLLGYLDLSGHLGFEEAVNLGMYDLIAALRWVRDNIAAFGGDPDNVTLFGQSGGGGKITTLMQMPEADGLYHKAIVQSGVLPFMCTPAQKRSFASALVSRVGPDAIRRIPYAQLVQHAKDAADSLGVPFFAICEPDVDGARLPYEFTQGFRPGTDWGRWKRRSATAQRRSSRRGAAPTPIKARFSRCISTPPCAGGRWNTAAFAPQRRTRRSISICSPIPFPPGRGSSRGMARISDLRSAASSAPRYCAAAARRRTR